MTEPNAPRDVVVTGGTGWLGAAVVAALVERDVVVHVPAFRAEELARFPLRDHPSVRVTPGVDLTNEAAVRAWYAGIASLWASIHCAGGFAMAPLERQDHEALQAMVDLNLVTCLHCCREAVSRMRDAGHGGRIVNVAAAAALEARPPAGMAAYVAAKAAVVALTRALAAEVAGDGILVNAIAPSIIDTPPNRAAMPGADHASWPTPADLARVIVFLASDANTAVQGAIVPVPGQS